MKRILLCLVPALALSACGGGETATRERTSQTSGNERRVVDPLAGRLPPPAINVVPIDPPRDLVFVLRVGALEPTYAALETLMRVPNPGRLMSDLEDATGSSILAGLVDRTKGVEIALVMAEDDPELVVAFDAPSMRDVVSAIPVSATVEPMSDGALLVRDRSADQSGVECAIEPTTEPTRTRIVCAKDIMELEIARLYLARNFATTLEAGHFEFELAVDSLRARYGRDLRAGFAISGPMSGSLLEQAAEDPELPAPARMLLENSLIRSKLAVVMRDFIDDASAMISDLASARAVGRIEGDVLHADVDLRVPNANGSLARALAVSLRRNGAVPSELVARLPPGATAYVSGDWNGAPFEDLSSEVREVLVAVAGADSRLPVADRDALERALALAYRQQEYSYALASGTDPAAQPWTVSAVRYANAAEARATVDAVRQLVAVLRRPNVARAFDRYFDSLGEDRPRFAQIADVRANGAPAGSYAVRMPPFEMIVTRLISDALQIPAPATAVPSSRTMLFVLSGRDLLAVQAPDAGAVYRGLASSGGLPTEIRSALAAGGWAETIAIRLGNYRLPGPVDRDAGARTLESILGTEAGQAVSFVRLRDVGTGNEIHLEMSVDVPGALVRGIADLD